MNNSRMHRTVSGETLSSAESRAITEYLEISKPEDCVQGMTPAKTPEAFLENLITARETIAAQRKSMVEAMSHDVLYSLLRKLCDEHGICPNPILEPRLLDSELAENENTKPAWREWRDRIERGVASEAEKEAAELGEAIAQGKEILGERWIGGAVDAREWFALALGDDAPRVDCSRVMRAWYGYVRVGDRLRIWEEDRSDQESLDQLRRLEKLTEQGEVCQAKIREQIAKPEGNQSEHGLRDELKELERSTNEDKARLAKVSKNIADREALRKFREGYEIGNTPPSHLEEKLRQDFASQWPEGKLLEHDVPKARLLCAWSRFWKQFGARYVTKINEEKAAQLISSETRKELGREGGIERTKLRYIRFTQAFVQWLGKREVTADLIRAFPKQEDVREQKGWDFLGVLLTAHSVPGSREAMEETLNDCGIKLPQSDVEECYGILFRGEIPPPKIK